MDLKAEADGNAGRIVLDRREARSILAFSAAGANLHLYWPEKLGLMRSHLVRLFRDFLDSKGVA